MWLALFAYAYSLPGFAGLLAGLWEIKRTLGRRRWDARSNAGVLLLLLTLTGRWWVRLLRAQGANDPQPLTPARSGTAISADGTALEWEQFGPDNAPALLLSHGWSLTHDTWYYQKIGLCPEYRVIVWDMRGEGRSVPYAGRDYSLETVADDLVAVFTASGAGHHPAGCVLAGHSVGAMILPLFARRHPDLMAHVRGMALLAGTDIPLLQSMRGRSWLVPLQKPLFTPLAHLMSRYPAPFNLYARLAWQMGAVHMALMYGLRSDHSTRGQDDLVAFRCAHFSMRAASLGALSSFVMDTRSALSQLTLPVLLLTGEDDLNMPPEVQREMLSRLRQGELILIPNCGHLNLLECYEEVNTHLRSFARRCFGQA